MMTARSTALRSSRILPGHSHEVNSFIISAERSAERKKITKSDMFSSGLSGRANSADMRRDFLSFLGLGVQAPLPSWGGLVKDGAEYMEDAPWMLVFPALFFSATLYALNRIGEAVSENLGDK